MIKGIIFDLDGVLVSTDEQHCLGWQALADKLGIPFSREVNNRFRGVSRMACMDILEEIGGKSYSPEEKQAYATWKNDYYRELLKKMSPADLSSEVKETLDALRDRGIKLAIGSSSKNAKFILERIGLADYFDAISDGTNISKSKPDPEVFVKAAGFLGLEPKDCLVVEDATAGVDAAHAGGMKAAAVGDAAEKKYGDYILSCFSQLLDVCRKESITMNELIHNFRKIAHAMHHGAVEDPFAALTVQEQKELAACLAKIAAGLPERHGHHERHGGHGYSGHRQEDPNCERPVDPQGYCIACGKHCPPDNYRCDGKK